MDQSAAYGSGYVIGTMLGYLLLCGGLIWLGVLVGNRLARRRGVLFVRWPVGLACVLVLLILAGECAPKSHARRAGGEPHANPATA